jgi:S-adenosylmethionine-diacylgycerolhomoserine-N-methlytransferase
MRALPSGGHAALMDGIYRHQRHVYDATRKYYLLGRDRLLAGLAVPAGGDVLELGCGTGRNLVLAGRRYPDAHIFGLDISAEMLASARRQIVRCGLAGRIVVAAGDATRFAPSELFGVDGFDRVYFSYTLSMIPRWQEAITAGLDALRPGGQLSIVDFGDQAELPAWFRQGLRRWLAAFHVAPRDRMADWLALECQRRQASLDVQTWFGGYAVYAAVAV